MPGTRCAVGICTNSYEKSKQHGLNISFHHFPKVEKIRSIWIKCCNRKDMWNTKTSTICSVHFKQEDFNVDFRTQLMNIKTKRKLKPSGNDFIKKLE